MCFAFSIAKTMVPIAPRIDAVAVSVANATLPAMANAATTIKNATKAIAVIPKAILTFRILAGFHHGARQ